MELASDRAASLLDLLDRQVKIDDGPSHVMADRAGRQSGGGHHFRGRLPVHAAADEDLPAKAGHLPQDIRHQLDELPALDLLIRSGHWTGQGLGELDDRDARATSEMVPYQVQRYTPEQGRRVGHLGAGLRFEGKQAKIGLLDDVLAH